MSAVDFRIGFPFTGQYMFGIYRVPFINSNIMRFSVVNKDGLSISAIRPEVRTLFDMKCDHAVSRLCPIYIFCLASIDRKFVYVFFTVHIGRTSISAAG
jgi:hypothetical protein